MDYGHPERAEALAGEYVAGTLRGAARRRFEALLPGHPALRAAVERWRDRLMPLTLALAPVAPPPGTWAAIERRLWPAAAAPAPQRWWQRLAPWRAATSVASLAALVLGLTLLRPPEAGAPIVVVLQATEAAAPAGVSTAAFVASVSADGRALVARPVQPVALGADRAFELWAVPPQGAPRSLGLVSASGVTLLRRDRLPPSLLDAGRTAALAVSVEPPGGSPTGAPTGPVIAVGRLQM